jgi:hypothetical protein
MLKVDAQNSSWVDTHFVGTVINHANFCSSRFVNIKFRDSRCTQALFKGCVFTGIDWTWASLNNAEFWGAVFEDCIISNTNLTHLSGDGYFFISARLYGEHVVLCEDYVQIGTVGHTWDEWDRWDREGTSKNPVEFGFFYARSDILQKLRETL